MIQNFPEEIKILRFNSYGGYGNCIPVDVIEMICNIGGEELVDYWFEKSYPDGYSGKSIRYDKHDKSRFDRHIISAFEQYIDKVENKNYATWKEEQEEKCRYIVDELCFNLEMDNFDGMESRPRITYC